jgi:hypothetical protein
MSFCRFVEQRAKTLIGSIAPLLIFASMVSTAAAQIPAPELWYKFDPAVDTLDPGGIHDSSPSGYNGTVVTPADVTLGQPGHTAGANAIHLVKDDTLVFGQTWGSGIATFQTVDALGVGVKDYTAMAWVNVDKLSGDNMVFGEASGNSLHLGFRDTQVYFGHWGNDTPSNTRLDAGTWHHVAWRYQTDGGLQSIFIDGSLDNIGSHGPLNNPGHLIVGRTVPNNGAFGGFLEDVRIYNVALTDDQIAMIAAGGG